MWSSFLEKIHLRFFYTPYTIGDYFRKKGALIGNNTRILVRDLGSEPYLVKIGDRTTISSGVVFVTHDGATALFRKQVKDIHTFNTIVILENCFVGINSILMPGIRIGPDSVVGAGAVVTKDVPAGTVVAGNPARVICTVEEYKKKSVDRFEKLGLQGSKTTWRPQLERYFWGGSDD